MTALRLFLAVEVKDPAILEKIENIQSELGATKTRMKLVRPENLHFTLKFLGTTPETLVKEISAIMQRIDVKKFPVTIKELGCFPRLSRPRVIWLGLSQGFEHLAKIAKFLDEELYTIGFEREKRLFSAHLTLARIKESRIDPQLTQQLKELQNIEIGTFIVAEVVLKKSTLTPKGPIYETLKTKSLSQREILNKSEKNT
ncbi:MAG: RNA 2',3'-cyclic phosphodiesterase [Candidatus Heimdallarchaeota archaeon]